MVSREVVVRCLLSATALTKGKRPDEIDDAAVLAWKTCASDEGMTDESFQSAFRAALDRSAFFPAWSEVLVEWRRIALDRSSLIADPVEVVEDGQVCVASRRSCEARGVGYREIGSGAVRNLPATDGGRRLLESVLEGE